TKLVSAIDPARLMPPTGLNLKNAGVKRILQEIKEVQADTSGDFIAEALEDDIFEWHFVIRGPADSEFEGGIYHGRILLPAEYPFKPPGFMMLTPSGRFETGVKICLTISSYHPEQWQPSWSVRTALTALVAFMPTPAGSAVGSLDYTKEERRALAIKSRTTIPKFGSAERQRITDEMHARMLAIPTPQARLLRRRHWATGWASTMHMSHMCHVPLCIVQAAGTSGGQAPTPAASVPPTPPTTSDVPGCKPCGTPNTHTTSSASSQDTAGGHTASAQPTLTQPTLPGSQGTLHKQQHPAAQPLVQLQQNSKAASTAPAQPSLPVPASSVAVAPTPSHAPQQAASVPYRRTAIPGHTPQAVAPSMPAAAMQATHVQQRAAGRTNVAGTAATVPPQDTWALTLLAVVLGVLICAILARKALAAAGYETARIASPFAHDS
ncbi:hypothetical protein QJQ45_025787, partial [Haematococcus lacustris]